MPATIERQVAYRVWLKQIHDSPYVKQEGWDPNYIQLGDKQISRINIVTTVVGKFTSEDGNYAALTLDDGTDTIRVKAFGPDVKLMEKATVGAVIRFVGKIKQYNDETYLAPEIIKPLDDPNWLVLQRLELGKIEPRQGEELASEAPLIAQKPLSSAPKLAENVASSIDNRGSSKLAEGEPALANEASGESASPKGEQNISSQILAKIQEKDAGGGAPSAEIITEIGDETLAKEKITDLLASGEIYEPKKGFLKLL